MSIDYQQKTKQLIDQLKAVCATFGLGNSGYEFDIITQVFLYKFLNDKFAYEVKHMLDGKYSGPNWLDKITAPGFDYKKMLQRLPPGTARLQPEQLLENLWKHQTDASFGQYVDDTLRAIAVENESLFSVKTETGAKVVLFDYLSQKINDPSKRDAFCRAIIDKLVPFSFEHVFGQKFDFFATIFEYLIKDYNKDGGGKYAEYYTPHAVAKIMAAILVDEGADMNNVSCYDPSAGSGSLLMNLAHRIGTDRCTIYSQDVSMKSTAMLRLNLILNNLVHSIQNVIEGDTLLSPFHKDGGNLRKFDFIVSNPPFKLDFSDTRAQLEAAKGNSERFFAGIPKVPNKDKDKMSIYLLFLQHIIYSLKPDSGRAAIVVPTGFITAQSGIEKKIRERLVEGRMLRGVVSMPSNIFATTGTNVSILFLDASNKRGDIVLMDASKLGTTIKEGKNQKTLLSAEEEQHIINTFNGHKAVEDFSVVVSYEDIAAKNYSLSAGQYFEVKIEYTDITAEEFTEKMQYFSSNLNALFMESHSLEAEIKKQMEGLTYAWMEKDHCR